MEKGRRSNELLLLVAMLCIEPFSLVQCSSRSTISRTGSAVTIERVPQLVDITTVNPRIQIFLVYKTENNFTKQIIYPQSAKAYLDELVAKALSEVQCDLEKQGLGLLVWDAYRPLSAQWVMWQAVPDERYVSNPRKGGRHTRGTAVDVTLVDLKTGKKLEMPTDFDDFTDKAWRSNVDCSLVARKNRQLLQDVMEKHGFEGMPYEWWHFDYKGWKSYVAIDDPFDALAKKSPILSKK